MASRPPRRPTHSRDKKQDLEDTWLDNEAEDSATGGRRSGKPKKKTSKSSLIDFNKANAVVTEVFPNQCRVSLDDSDGSGGEEILCSYRRVQLLSSSQSASGARERTPVALGDRVLAERLNPQSGVIQAVAPRANFLARPAPGRENEIHIVAANVDLLVIVASVALPDFSPGLVDRYLIAGRAAGIAPLLCVTKADLIRPVPGPGTEPRPKTDRLWKAYGEIGYDETLVCAKTGVGIDDVKTRISGKTVVFCGHSGVGKTSLFRAIMGRDIGKVGDVNVQTGKGRHTTTSAILYRDIATASSWIDTPGIREFGLIGVTPESLASYFPEFASLECARRGCHHLGEPSCKAFDLFRYSSYRRIHESLLEAAR